MNWTIEFAALEATSEVKGLLVDIASAASRALKAEVGERDDVERFEALCARLEYLAGNTPKPRTQPTGDGDLPWPWQWPQPTRPEPGVDSAAKSIAANGYVPVTLTLPIVEAPAPIGQPISAKEPADKWTSKHNNWGARAVRERFEDQLADTGTGTFCPSGVKNDIITNVLHAAVYADGKSRQLWVEYRDGSRSANPFTVSALSSRRPTKGRQLNFALMSIRHTELDALVHGAWLRNRQVSQLRPHALTDDLVYEITREQLQALCTEPTAITLYQTGFEPAVVGFYKAVVDHLIDHPNGGLSVIPMFFRNAPIRLKSSNGGRDQRGKRKPAQKSSSDRYETGPVWA